MIGFGISRDDREFLKQLLYVTALRGDDGTGLATIKTFEKHKNSVRLHKGVADASYFLYEDSKKKAPMLSDYSADLFIGHCRAATIGALTPENSHPFDVGNLVGAHNGTLRDREFALDKSKTDSEQMFQKMNSVGIAEVLENLNAWSAYAVSIYDKKEKVLYLARNSERPLHIAVNQKRGVIYWASERGMLQFVADRCKLDIGEVLYLKPGFLYKFKSSGISASKEVNWETTQLKEKLPITTSRTTAASYGMWDEDYWTGGDQDWWEKRQAELKDGWTDVSCCVCQKTMSSKSDGVVIDGVTYFTCKECNDDIAKASENQKNIRVG